MALVSTQLVTDISEIFLGIKGDRNVRLTTWLSSTNLLKDVGVSTSHNCMGLHGPLQRQLYLSL
jgi:hypothetical protein